MSLRMPTKGPALASLGQFENAIKCYNKALELDPDNAIMYTNTGITFAEFGQFENAIKCYNKALELDPDDAATHANKGIAT